MLRVAHDHDASYLPHRFQQDHAGHYRSTGKMSQKEVFIKSHAFDANRPFHRFHLQYPIDKQHWITMG